MKNYKFFQTFFNKIAVDINYVIINYIDCCVISRTSGYYVLLLLLSCIVKTIVYTTQVRKYQISTHYEPQEIYNILNALINRR